MFTDKVSRLTPAKYSPAFAAYQRAKMFVRKTATTPISRRWITATGLLLLILSLLGSTVNIPTSQAVFLPVSVDTIYVLDEDGIVDVEERIKDRPQPMGALREDRVKPSSKNADELTREYIKRYAPIAIAEQKKFGIPASITLAQGILESRYGTSKLAVNNNNHFGIKCFAKKCRRGHCTNHTDDTHKDFFRVYPSAWESYRAHSLLLVNGVRYRPLFRTRDYKKWAYGLQTKGYATDKRYAAGLIGIITKYQLYKYDR